MEDLLLPGAAVSDEERQLWQQWLALRDADTRTRLFFHHSAWSRTVAGYYYNRYPHPLAEWHDYLSLTSQGLLQAIDVDLAGLLGVGKARVSQLHGQALRRIRGLYEEVGGMEWEW